MYLIGKVTIPLIVTLFIFSFKLSTFSQENKIKIGVISIKSENQKISDKVINFLNMSLLDYDKFEVNVCNLDKCDVTLEGEVADIKSEEKQVKIKLNLKAKDTTGNILSKIEATGKSRIKIDYKQDKENQLDEAIMDAVYKTRENLIISLTKVGIVKYIKPDKTIGITLGEVDNLKKGAEIGVFKNNKKIATYEILETEKTGATAKLKEKFSDLSIAPQDKVRIIFNPQEVKDAKKKEKLKIKPWQTALGGIALVYLLAKKDKKEKPPEQAVPLPPTTRKVVITLAISEPVIPADNITTTTIIATVKDAETNVAVPDGTVVNFKTDLGMITNVTTTRDGRATCKLHSDKVGSANITASVGDMFTSAQVTFSPHKVIISASPENILADGISTSIITVNVRNASTGAATVGITVYFSTSLGSILPSSLQTDSMGTAIATLTSSTTPGIARISIKVGDIASAVDINFSTATTTSITLLAFPAFIPADGITTSLITATVKDPQTNKFLPDGTLVEFTTSAGILLGDMATISSGKASTRLISDTLPGVAIITAKVGIFSATCQVSFTPLNITISAEPPMIIATGKSTSRITATVSDINNNPSPNGTVVYFTTSIGSVVSPVATFDGIATTTLTSSIVSTSTFANITATSGGTSASCSVLLVPSEPSIIVIIPDKNILPADGKSESKLVVVVKDKENNLVPGVDVKLTTNRGTFSNGQNTITLTTVDGIVSEKIKSLDFGEANIKAECKDISTSVKVEFTQLKIVVLASPTSILANGSSTTTITVSVVDAKTNISRDNIPLTLATSDGTLSSSSGTTNTEGKFTTLLTSSMRPGFVIVSAASGSAIGETTIVFTSLGVSSITLVASPTTIPADGVSTSIITATVKDNYGNFVEDGTRVDFTSSDPNSKITPISWTKDGTATATLTSSTGAQRVLIEAKAGNVSAYCQVTFSAGVPAFVRIGAHDFNIHGWDLLGNMTTITIYVYDSNHNPVSDGTVVNFTTEGGMITKSSSTASGVTTATLISTGSFPVGNEGTIGYSTITATSGPAYDTTVILFSGKPYAIALTATPNTIPGKGGKSTIIARVFDVNGNPVDSGFPVKFMTTLGGFNPEPQIKEEGDAPVSEIIVSTYGHFNSFYQNKAEVTLYGWEAIGTTTITAICGDAFATVNVLLTP